MKFSAFLLVMAVIVGSVFAALAISPETGRAAAVIALGVLGLVAFAEVKGARQAKEEKARSGGRR